MANPQQMSSHSEQPCSEQAQTSKFKKRAVYGHKRAKTSCHQCKNNKEPDGLLFCKNVKWGPGKKPGNYVLKHCRKKFCSQCMSKYAPLELVQELFLKKQANENMTERDEITHKLSPKIVLCIVMGLQSWKCPACTNNCECAACLRQRKRCGGDNTHSDTNNSEESKASDDGKNIERKHKVN
ncbi:hypothetical protein RFI_05047 [Reticulomyxa filosa]|uniref:Zinc-finger domain-containing protein n=1 Tax=Reticulomyxa filosa TaxID=46433 RepID=X6P1Q6_RETFI|nr:hypothetical protein RFI_05047 [Reticulomyxa filosa]|eukprot:ETO32073.1 hypothetical protein RFI_05047 [Reticulomyxa filosa]